MVNIITKINKNIIIKTIIIETGDSLGYYKCHCLTFINLYTDLSCFSSPQFCVRD